MSPIQIFTAAAIHLVVPLAEFVLFAVLYYQMKKAGIPSPPWVPCFFLSFSLCGWLLIALILLFWEFSAMAVLGLMFLVVIAPRCTLAAAWMLRTKRMLFIYHRLACFGNLIYTLLILVTVAGFGIVGKAYQQVPHR